MFILRGEERGEGGREISLAKSNSNVFAHPWTFKLERGRSSGSFFAYICLTKILGATVQWAFSNSGSIYICTMCGRDRFHPEWRVRRTKFHSGRTPVDTGPTRDAAHCWPTMVCASHSVDTETRNSGATSFWTSKWMSSPRVSKLPRFPAKTFSLFLSLEKILLSNCLSLKEYCDCKLGCSISVSLYFTSN